MFTLEAVARPRKKRALRGRRLVVVDIENVVGGAVTTRAMAEWARNIVESALAVVDGEQVVIGTSHVGLFNTKAAWGSARVRVRSGQNGADVELLDVLMTEHLERRFDAVALVSGDGIFSEAVAQLGGSGVQVTVASWVKSMSPRLKLAAKDAIYLDHWTACTATGEVA